MPQQTPRLFIGTGGRTNSDIHSLYVFNLVTKKTRHRINVSMTGSKKPNYVDSSYEAFTTSTRPAS